MTLDKDQLLIDDSQNEKFGKISTDVLYILLLETMKNYHSKDLVIN